MTKNIKAVISGSTPPSGLEAIIKQAELKTTKTGNPYVAGVLIDRSGEIAFNVWAEGSTMDIMTKAGTPVILNKASSSEYQGKLQLKIEKASSINIERAKLAGIIPASQIPIDVLKDDFEKIVDAIEKVSGTSGFKHIRDVIKTLEQDGTLDKFYTHPAAISMHHAYLHGLLEHSVQVARLAFNACNGYKTHPTYQKMDKGLLLTAALWHDIGKLDEFTLGPLGLVEEYSLEGGMSTHMVTGVERITRMYSPYLTTMELTKLRHIILSHHGNLEWGAVVVPACFEALLVHHADMIDSIRGSYLDTDHGVDKVWYKPYGRSRMLNSDYNVPDNVEI